MKFYESKWWYVVEGILLAASGVLLKLLLIP
jgi:hypothetical protein